MNRTILIIFTLLLLVNLGLGFYYFYDIYIPQRKSSQMIQTIWKWEKAENIIKSKCKIDVEPVDQKQKSEYGLNFMSIAKIAQNEQGSSQPPVVAYVAKDSNEAYDQEHKWCRVFFVRNTIDDGVVLFETEKGEIEKIRLKDFPLYLTK